MSPRAPMPPTTRRRAAATADPERSEHEHADETASDVEAAGQEAGQDAGQEAGQDAEAASARSGGKVDWGDGWDDGESGQDVAPDADGGKARSRRTTSRWPAARRWFEGHGTRPGTPAVVLELLEATWSNRLVAAAVATATVLLGLFVAVVAPDTLPATPLVGAAVGLAAVLVGAAGALVADSLDPVLRGPRHVRAVAADVALTVHGRGRDAAAPLASRLAQLRDDGAEGLAVVLAEHVTERDDLVAGLVDALAERRRGLLVLDLVRVDEQRGLGDLDTPTQLAQVLDVDLERRLAVARRSSDLERSVEMAGQTLAALPPDVDTVLLATSVDLPLPPELDVAVVVMDLDASPRTELAAVVDSADSAGIAIEVVLLAPDADPAAATVGADVTDAPEDRADDADVHGDAVDGTPVDADAPGLATPGPAALAYAPGEDAPGEDAPGEDAPAEAPETDETEHLGTESAALADAPDEDAPEPDVLADAPGGDAPGTVALADAPSEGVTEADIAEQEAAADAPVHDAPEAHAAPEAAEVDDAPEAAEVDDAPEAAEVDAAPEAAEPEAAEPDDAPEAAEPDDAPENEIQDGLEAHTAPPEDAATEVRDAPAVRAGDHAPSAAPAVSGATSPLSSERDGVGASRQVRGVRLEGGRAHATLHVVQDDETTGPMPVMTGGTVDGVTEPDDTTTTNTTTNDTAANDDTPTADRHSWTNDDDPVASTLSDRDPTLAAELMATALIERRED